MVIKIGGFRKRTRHKLKKGLRQKGKISLRRFFQEFSVGDAVCLKAEPAYQKGMYFPRLYHGKTATVTGKRGQCYILSIRDQNQMKMLIVHPVHLDKIQGTKAKEA